MDYGYCFHYTRKLDGIPITYTDVPGGSIEADAETEPWSYEALEVLVSKDGMEELYLMNQYDIGEAKVKNLELLSFSEIIEIYEKMMVVRNADVLTDKGEENLTEYPVKERTYNTDRIVLGYARIYDPQADEQTGLLVPAWDFFGEDTMDYGAGMETVRNRTSFLTINAVDGTVIDRWLGY